MKYRVRKKHVIVRVEYINERNGIAMPQSSIQGKRFIVEEVASDVEDLKKGDVVLMAGQKGINYQDVPNTTNLIIIHEDFVLIVCEEEFDAIVPDLG